MQVPPHVDIDELLDRYDAFLLDAYGVLVTGDGVLPGAAAFIGRLEAESRSYFVVTNDASRLPETVADRFVSLGLPIPAERVVTSGSLIGNHYRDAGLRGRRSAVLGPGDSAEYVRRAGGELVSLDTPFDVLVACDERGTPFLEGANAALSTAYRHIDAGGALDLVLPNPDLIYPGADGQYRFTAGALAVILEHGLALRYPERDDLRFVRLGKPEPVIFEEGMRRAGTRNVVMIGDQLATDIAGANAAGIDSALIAGGVSSASLPKSGPRPTWLLSAFDSVG